MPCMVQQKKLSKEQNVQVSHTRHTRHLRFNLYFLYALYGSTKKAE